jgi:hypothetical protein
MEGHSLPYRIFRKGKRVSHTAVGENKRLGHALAMIKMQQEIKHAPKLKTNKREDRLSQERTKDLRPTGNAGELGAGPSNGGNAGPMKSAEDRTINHPVSPSSRRPCPYELCGYAVRLVGSSTTSSSRRILPVRSRTS